MTILVIPMPYSFIPVATWLVVGGALVWKIAKSAWLRGIGIIVFASGIIFSAIILLLAYMVFNGRLVKETILSATPEPTQVGMVVDNRAIRQKTQIPYGHFRCTPNPVGLTLTALIEPETVESSAPVSQTLRIEGKGFAPNETLNFFLRELWVEHPRTVAFNETVNADGTFLHTEFVPRHAPHIEWQLWVAHQRGMACAQFLGN